MMLTALIDADQRLVILRLLNETPDAALGEAILQNSLGLYGHNIPREKVREQIVWLAEAGAVEKSTVGETVIARLKDKGLDHIKRRAFIDGIARPSLG